MNKLIVVGYGNMAKAVLSGIFRKKASGSCMYGHIQVVGREPSKLSSWIEAQRLDSSFVSLKKCKTENGKMIVELSGSDILLACKPGNLVSFSFIGTPGVVYSVLAGVSCNELRGSFDYKCSKESGVRSTGVIARIMPNVAAIHGLSSSSVYVMYHDSDHTSSDVGSEHLDVVEEFVSYFGNCVFLDSEYMIDSSIATNGSAQAIIALVAQAIVEAGVHEGLSLRASTELTKKSFEGFAELFKHMTPQEIRDMITSPGGTTSRAILSLQKDGVAGKITNACLAAVNKARGK